MKSTGRLALAIAGMVWILVTGAAPLLVSIEPVQKARPQHWAKKLTRAGLPNLYKVDDTLYRGAQPTKQGLKNLEKMGIKTVVNLRSMHSDRDKLKETQLGYEHIASNTFHPELEDVVRFLRIVADPARQPVFVHCQHGADRTGMMVAFYRIVFQGWSKEEAIREMTDGGFGFHGIWKNLLVFIRTTDIKMLRESIGPRLPVQ